MLLRKPIACQVDNYPKNSPKKRFEALKAINRTEYKYFFLSFFTSSIYFPLFSSFQQQERREGKESKNQS
jgi:hypothetical protein